MASNLLAMAVAMASKLVMVSKLVAMASESNSDGDGLRDGFQANSDGLRI